MKNKLDELTKAKLIYSGELLIISLVFIVVAILRLVGVMESNSTFHTIFNWITIFGGTWIIIDCVWTTVSPTKRAKTSLLDKYLNLPAGIFLIIFDIMCFTGNIDDNGWKTLFPIFLIYLGIDYIIQSIYHWFKPLPALLEDDESEKKEDGKME